MKSLVNTHKSENVILISFSQWGFIRKVYCSTENSQVKKIHDRATKYRHPKEINMWRLSKISTHSTFIQTLLLLKQHRSANKMGSCWWITLLQGWSLGWIRGTANTLLSGGKNRWLSSTSLTEEEEGCGGGGGGGSAKGKHDLALVVSTVVHVKASLPLPPPPPNQSKYTWDMLGGAAWGIGMRVIIQVLSW